MIDIALNGSDEEIVRNVTLVGKGQELLEERKG